MKLHLIYGSVVLLLVLLGAYLFYTVVDSSVTAMYQEQQLHELEETRKQLMSALPDLSGKMSKDEIVGVMRKYSDQEPYEKEGCTWVGWVGLKFSPEGKLVHASPGWSFVGAPDPCFEE